MSPAVSFPPTSLARQVGGAVVKIWSDRSSGSIVAVVPRKKTTKHDGAVCECGGCPYNNRKAQSSRAFSNFLLYIRLLSSEILPMYGKLASQGALPQLATPLFCFESAQQLKRPRREWQGSLPQLATLSILTRVKLDRSSGRIKGGKVVCPATSTPGRPMEICPQDAALGLLAGKPTRLT